MTDNATNRVLKYLLDNNYTGHKTYSALGLMRLIYSDETIKKWSHARRHKVIIETMTYSFIGKLKRKEYVSERYRCGDKDGVYISKLGIEFLSKQTKNEVSSQ